MNAEINKEIIDKIKNSSQTTEVKEFLYEILEFEYDHIDESNPRFKETYKNAIKKYK